MNFGWPPHTMSPMAMNYQYAASPQTGQWRPSSPCVPSGHFQRPPYPFHPGQWNNQHRAWQPQTSSGSWTGNGNPPRQKKMRQERKEPEFVDYCDVCDRGFKNVAKKIEHYKQHVKCDELGCDFEAHFKIVAMHKKNLHGPNAFRIKVETPDEIKRWREERKRKYPSMTNIQRKAELVSEREKQGNIIDNKDFSKMRRNKKPMTLMTVQKPNASAVELEPSCTEEVQKGCSAAPKSLLLSNPLDSDDISSDDDSTAETVANSGTTSALGSLMQSYASESESDDNAIPNSENPKQVPSVPGLHSSAPSNPDVNLLLPCNDPQGLKKKSFSPTTQSNRPQRQIGHFNGKKRQSLLEMLLANDIRRERNHILQCVRFVVENNFFQPEST